MTLWADGDSLQAEIRRIICKRAIREAAQAAARGGEPRLKAVFVAARAPSLDSGPGVELILVPPGDGAADDKIAAEARCGDLAVTRDIPLAQRLAENGIRVLNDRGEILTLDKARERRSLRDRAAELRALGLAPESPRARSWGQRELKAFADALDRELGRALKGS